MTSTMKLSPSPDARPTDPLYAIAKKLSSATTSMGMVAALRRFNPVTDGQHNVFEIQHVLLDAGIDLAADSPAQQHWALIVHCLAIVRGAHHEKRDTGAQLAALGLTEARMRQLIDADGPLLVDLLPTLARRLASAGVSLNWWPLALLVLTQDDEDPTRSQDARREIVQGFLR